MSRFAKKVENEDKGQSIPRPPTLCGCHDCPNDAFLAMAVCRVDGGDAQIGALKLHAKEAPVFSRRVKGHGWLNTTNFSFVRWITRCQRCYMRETRLDRALEDAIAARDAA